MIFLIEISYLCVYLTTKKKIYYITSNFGEIPDYVPFFISVHIEE